MAESELIVRGRVTDLASGDPLAGIRVTGVATESDTVALVFTGISGADGYVDLCAPASVIAALYGSTVLADAIDDTQQIHFSTYIGSILIGEYTEPISLQAITTGELPNLIRVDMTAYAPGSYVVRGKVVDGDGVPKSTVTVTLEHVEVGNRNSLGTTTTDANGEYSIAYAGGVESRVDASGLPVQVIVSDGSELGRSVVIADPGADHRVDVVLDEMYYGRGEHDRVQAALTPHLNSATLSELGADDLEILSQRADVYPPHVAFAIQAARLADGTSVSESTFYALLRERLPTSMAGLLSTPRAARESALRAAYEDRVLPPPGGTVDAAVAAAMTDLDALVVDAALAAPTGGETNVRALLDTSGLAESQLRLFVEHWVANDEDEEAMWTAVDADPLLSTGEVDDLRFTVEGAALARGFLPALTELHAQRTATTISGIVDLAAWDTAEWTTFVTTTGAPTDLPGADAAEREALYAATLNRIVESIYPTQVLGHRIARDTPASTTGVSEFIAANPDFDVRNDIVAAYLDANPGSIPGGQDPTDTQKTLEIVQRVYSLTPPMHNYATTQILLDGAVTSALDVVTMGKTSFVETFASQFDGVHPMYTGGELANAIFTQAEFKHGATIALASTYAPQMNTISVAAVQANLAAATGDGSGQLLDIFGSLDYCACEHCRSVFSPAAYLVDLLVALDTIDPANQSVALDELHARRPDIRALQLSCANTNTELPYIDLVNEMLEERVQGNPPAAQDTTWSAGELRLFPEHRNIEAYDGAATAAYPWSLPLHVPTEEARGYLERLGTARAEVMRTFRSNAVPASEDIVAEALSMTPFEADVVIGAEPSDKAQVWDLANAGFAATLSQDLRMLLGVADLELDEFMEVVTSPWVVPGTAVSIDYPGEPDEPTCDLDQLSLLNFGDDEADRLHRLLRFARKTGLDWWDADRAIRTLGGAPAEQSIWTNGLVFRPDMSTLEDTESDNSGVNDGTTYNAAEQSRSFADDLNRVEFAPVASFVDDPVTVSMWVRCPDWGSAERRIWSTWENSADVACFLGGMTTGAIRFWHENDGGASCERATVAGVLQDDTWHHIVLTYDGSNTSAGVHIYVDGVEPSYAVNASGAGTPRNASASFTLGYAQSGVGFAGDIRDVRAWDHELTSVEIASVMDDTPDLRPYFSEWRETSRHVPQTGLVFEPDLELLVDPLSSQTGTASGTAFDGYHRALVTAGDASSCSWPSIADFTGAAFTFVAWIRPRVTGSSDILFSIDGTASSDAYQVRINNDSGRIEFIHVYDGGGTHRRRVTIETIPRHTWSHVAVTVDGTASGTGIHIFINGVEATYSSVSNGSGGTPRVPDGNWYLGNTSLGTQGFNGHIREPRVWNLELAAADIAALYGAAPTVTDTEIDHNFLAWFVDARNVADRLGMTIEDVLPLWSNVDTHAYRDMPSTYERLFLSRSVSPEPDPAFALNSTGTELDSTPALSSSAHYDTIRSALQINDADLERLVGDVLTSSVLNLANLSALLRHAVLAQAMGISITELLQLLAIVPVSPFGAPGATVEFLDAVDDIRSTKMTIAQLDYVCRHVFDANGSEHLSDTAISDLVLGIQAEIADAATALVQAGNTEPQALTDEIAVIVPRAFSDAFGISPQAATSLSSSTTILDVGGVSIRDVIADTTTLVGGEPGPEHTEAVVRMHKAAVLINGLGIAGDDIAWYFVDGEAPQGLDLRALPITAAVDGSSVFKRWHAVFQGQELQSSFSASANVLRIAAAEADLASATATLVANSDWGADDVAFITGVEHLGLTSQADIADPAIVTRIRDGIDLVRRSGVKAETLADWTRNVPDESAAAAARRALKARHGEAAWPGVIRPVTDALRERQRDALVALLITTGTYADENAIYEDLLVDSQMNACMLTSRIKLAISSVQLMVQRCLMGLEPAVSIPALDSGDNVPVVRQWWVWMKNYRLWEANRRVFFYPENWAEPELRDDKTPLFKELEAQLDQGSLAPDEIERAFADYLYGLHEISHLDVVAIHDERSTEVSDVVHVVGRTRSEPKKHFYRSRIDDMYWTPWVPIELEIASDNVVLTAHNRRLFLIWVERIELSSGADLDNISANPVLQYKVFWSERRHGTWSPVRSTPPVNSPEFTNKESVHVVTSSGDNLMVDVTHWHYVQGANIVVARFEYDDCLDRMVSNGDPSISYLEQQFGLPPERHYGSQQQRLIAGEFPIPFRLIHRLANVTLQPEHYSLITDPGGFSATLPTEGYRLFSPCVFDNESQSLYIVPSFTAVPLPAYQPPGPWETFAFMNADASGQPGDAVANPALAVVDDIVVATPWASEPPGMAKLLVDGELASADGANAEALFSAAQGTVSSISDLELTADPPSVLGLYQGWYLSNYEATPFKHPYTCWMRSELNRHGVDGVLASRKDGLKYQVEESVAIAPPDIAVSPGTPQFTTRVKAPWPIDSFDFSREGAYSVYNWEIFFHVPLYIAERLRKEQRFEEAQRWYHYVFNPVAYDDDDGTERYWNIKPFRNEASDGYPDVIQSIFQNDGLNAEFEVLKDFVFSIVHWLHDPFNPHRIARWRRGTYRWVVVRKYLDNLLDWADALFRRDTIESINEATQLYALAAEILGERPVQTPEMNPVVENYDGLTAPVLFGGLATLENALSGAPTLPYLPASGFSAVDALSALDGQPQQETPPPPAPMWWYFCTPPNDQLLAYWDRVADRLFKIRNCKNIDGIGRTLSLFEPPIDPSLIIKAKAAGLDLADIIADLQAPAPHHRYRVLARQALELCGDVRALGAALLQALERGDAEALQELRSTHEVNVLESVRRSRKARIEEAQASLETIVQQRESAVAREEYYLTRERRTPKEESHLKRLRIAMGLNIGAQSTKLLAAILRATVPALRVGTASSKEIGGQILTDIEEIVSGGLNLASFIVRETAGMQQIHAGYDRRFHDWQFQGRQAQLDQKAIDKQEAAAEIRLDIAQKELGDHDLQIAQAKIVREYLESRFTSQDLHHWLEGEISKLYFQAYKLAYNLAKKAERALQVEHDVSDIYVTPDHWDGLRKGLLAGERLQMDLRRMDAAYLDLDRRELELTKRISLRQLNPEALVDLRTTGACTFDMPEVLFDLDHPGHYRRRIKSVSLSIPAVVGPHTSIGATLALTDSEIRISPTPGGTYAQTSLVDGGTSGVSSVATSTGRADSGVFDLDFRDEKLLPFEGAGVISSWSLTLPGNVRQFDYDTISDVELEIRYTARDGGFRTEVETQLASMVQAALASGQLSLMLSGRAAFPVDLEQFLYPASGQTVTTIELPIVLERFTHAMRSAGTIQVTNVDVRWKTSGPADDAIDDSTPANASVAAPAATSSPVSFSNAGEYSIASFSFTNEPVTEQAWTLDLNALNVTDPDAIEDLIVIVDVTVA